MYMIYNLLRGDYETVDRKTLRRLYDEGDVVLLHGRGIDSTKTQVAVGPHHDARGQRDAMYEETWTQKPKSFKQVCAISRWK